MVIKDLDLVNHPPHYTNDPSGVECIQITRWMNFNVGNAFKYLYRAGSKNLIGDALKAQIEDLRKAVWYLKDELANMHAELRPDFRHLYAAEIEAVIKSRSGQVAVSMSRIYAEDIKGAIFAIEFLISELEKTGATNK